MDSYDALHKQVDAHPLAVQLWLMVLSEVYLQLVCIFAFGHAMTLGTSRCTWGTRRARWTT